MKLALEPEQFKALTSEQRVAVVEALVASVLADGRADPAEVARFNDEIARLPWELDRPALLALVKGAQQRVATLKGPTEVDAFIKGVAALLPDPALREQVFATMASVMFADRQMSQLEKNVLAAFVLAFGLTEEQVKAVKAHVTKT